MTSAEGTADGEGPSYPECDAELDRSMASSDAKRRVHWLFAIPTIMLLVVISVGFIGYVRLVDGAERTSALFAAGLVAIGSWLLLWSYVRKPPPGEDDDFLDKLLAGAGRALLLGAVLSFGFGVVGQELDSERAESDRARDLVRQVRADAGGGAFPRLDLSGAFLGGLDLSGFDFGGADLSGASLFDTNLSDANLVFADLSDADLSDANLTDSMLLRADLTDANLRDADLTGAELRSANLQGAYLVGASLRDADLRNAGLSDANLSGADLISANLTDVSCDDSTTWPVGFDPPPCEIIADP